MKSALYISILTLAAPLFAEKFCYKHTTAKATSTVTFDSEQNRISEGLYKIVYANGKSKSATFYGTKSGTVYAIAFKGKAPYKLPKGEDTIVWIRPERNLIIPMYGRHKSTHTYAEYKAAFSPCKAR